MRKIDKKQPPASFVTYVKSSNVLDPTYKPTFEDLDATVRKDLQNCLLNEQGGICGYCQQKITSLSRMKIEHHCEQSICNGENGSTDKTLDYTNLMGVCMGIGGKKELHCDTKKSQFNNTNGLPIKISPWNKAHMGSVSYASTGNINSSNSVFQKEIDNILSLNTKYLKDLREQKYRKIFSTSNHKQPATFKAKMKKILEHDLENNGSRFSNNFPGMSEYMLNKFC